MIGDPGDDRSAEAQARRSRDLSGHVPDHVARIVDRRDAARVPAGGGQQIVGEGGRAEVVEAALERPVALAVASARELAAKPLVRAADASRARDELGLVALQPAQARADRLLRHAGARAREHGLVAELGAQLGDLSLGPAVVVEQRRPQRLVVLVKQQQAWHAAGHADRRDLGRRDRRRRTHLRDDRERAGQPVSRIGLRVRRTGRRRGVRQGGGPDDAARRIEHDRLERRRADVQPEQH